MLKNYRPHLRLIFDQLGRHERNLPDLSSQKTCDDYMRSLCKQNLHREALEVFELLEDNTDFRITPSTYAHLICACSSLRSLGHVLFDAFKVFEDIRNAADSVSWNAIIIYASSGCWGDVARLRNFMKERGVMKVPGQSWIEVKGNFHVFLAEDTLHPEIGKIYEMLEELWLQMLDDGEAVGVRVGILVEFEFAEVRQMISLRVRKQGAGMCHWCNLVLLEEAESILRLPVGGLDKEDILCWHYTNSGVYSVDSGYWVARMTGGGALRGGFSSSYTGFTGGELVSDSLEAVRLLHSSDPYMGKEYFMVEKINICYFLTLVFVVLFSRDTNNAAHVLARRSLSVFFYMDGRGATWCSTSERVLYSPSFLGLVDTESLWRVFLPSEFAPCQDPSGNLIPHALMTFAVFRKYGIILLCIKSYCFSTPPRSARPSSTET
ncbi:hypothetical protein FEM48_ZijujUnG0011200 [Ziziphus jujuba var. spinosa]|uniref:Pentatricopeptide repeat-containing protein n=1 Tax=Ziziphus jujuba var. spinosa TaxID=714518 RepID=A0A978U9Y6_ZIZJJ|nr:hypothetical protein FEM48_ZijujUnG0011200 [Ziziphus jujuba var. spinosa]